MYQEIRLWSSIRQHHEESLREARVRGLAEKDRSEGLLLVRAEPLELAEEVCHRLVRAEPLELAEEVCHRMVDVVRVMDDTLLLGADPTWAGAINTVLVKKGVRVSELRCIGGRQKH
jgi:hypothetical protein